MKAKYIFTTLALSSALLFSSCSDDKVSEPISRDTRVDAIAPVQKSVIEVAQGEATSTSCTLTFTPQKDEVKKYVTLVMPRATYNLLKPSELAAKALEQSQKEAEMMSKTLSEYLTSMQAEGETTREFKGLMPNTAYSVLTFEREGDTLKGTSLNDRFYFSTRVADKLDLAFETSTDVDGLITRLTVTPSKKDVGYFVFNFTKAQYLKLVEENKFTDEQILFNYFKQKLYSFLQTGSEEEMVEARAKTLVEGDRVFRIQSEAEDTEYVYMMASFIAVDPYTIVMTSDVHKGVYVSGKSKILPYTFDIKVFDITDTHFGVKITPSDDKVVYVWRQGALTDDLKGLTPEQHADQIINAPFFGFPGDRNMGVIEYAKLQLASPGSPHYVIAFGFQGKTRVTKVAYYKFETGTPADPSTVTFDTENVAVSPYSANVKFTPSDNRVYYAMSLLKDGTTTSQEQKEYFQTQLTEGFEGFKKANPTLDKQRYIDAYYFRGTSYFEFSDLEPETSYTLYTYAISADDATVVKVDERKSYLTTPALSDAKVTAELFGVFDANEVTTDMIGNIEQSRGAAIVVVKFNFSDNAVEGRGFLVPKTFREIELNPKLISDKEIQTKLKQYFAKPKKGDAATHYAFYACRWGDEQVSLSYGIDALGGTGPVVREKLVKPTKSNVTEVAKLGKLIKDLESGQGNGGASGSSVSSTKSRAVSFSQKASKVVIAKKSKAVTSVGQAPIR